MLLANRDIYICDNYSYCCGTRSYKHVSSNDRERPNALTSPASPPALRQFAFGVFGEFWARPSLVFRYAQLPSVSGCLCRLTCVPMRDHSPPPTAGVSLAHWLARPLPLCLASDHDTHASIASVRVSRWVVSTQWVITPPRLSRPEFPRATFLRKLARGRSNPILHSGRSLPPCLRWFDYSCATMHNLRAQSLNLCLLPEIDLFSTRSTATSLKCS